ncbi:uncharacterized protein LOC129284469 [Prosopis cineraria]|uniref:uncharacterized protein LOC129284469 n=1 Tax=Prosopis cineraria TaxID=364024 RepID=UPI00240F46E9|nr:uncharacterized protein LOC129284469 [Prosopis cineraria]XP_054775937.1 uncharacterized protein LOC129284469 [Prosopis cineraria]
MPTQQVICRKGKAVLVRVYVEKPRKMVVPSNHLYHHHHYHHYHVVHHNGSPRQGYDRKAELLRYSQFLRNSARKAPSTTLLPFKQISNNVNEQPSTRVVPSMRKQMHEGNFYSCFGNWKLLIPSFLRSRTSSEPKNREKKKEMQNRLPLTQITSFIKILRVKRRKCLFPRMFSSTRKH